MNDMPEKAIIIIDSMLKIMRQRSYKEAPNVFFNSINYILVMKKKYVCQLKLIEDHQENMAEIDKKLLDLKRELKQHLQEKPEESAQSESGSDSEFSEGEQELLD